MKVAVIELEYHVECLSVLADLVEASEKIETHYFVNKIGEQTLSRKFHNSAKVYVQKESESKNKFLNRYIHEFHHSDLVFIATLEQHWRAYKDVIQKSNVLLRVHGLNYHFSKRFQLVSGLNQLGVIGIIREFYWQNHFWKKTLIPNINYFTPTLLSQSYASFIQSDLRWVPPVPLSFFSNSNILVNDTFTVVVPGSVENTRRNYGTVIQAISALQSYSIKWVLLGEMKSETIKDQIDLLVENGCIIEYYAHNVPDALFEEQLKKCNLVFAPVRDAHPFKDVMEVPGKTKISGATSDALLFGKPILLPAGYPFQKEWSELGIHYRNVEDIQSIIPSLMKRTDLEMEKLLTKKQAILRIEDIFTRCLN